MLLFKIIAFGLFCWEGPEVRGSRPVLVSFASYKDREEILSKSRLLKGTNIYITEDLSRKMREHRSELTKYMRQVKHFYTSKLFLGRVKA